MGAFAAMNVVVGALAIAERRQGRKNVFPAALMLMVIGQTSALMIWNTAEFRSFAERFKTIPLPLGY